jgi:predicted TIM-barrel enzyme
VDRSFRLIDPDRVLAGSRQRTKLSRASSASDFESLRLIHYSAGRFASSIWHSVLLLCPHQSSTENTPVMESSTLNSIRKAPVIPTGNVPCWIEPWYVAYAILEVLASSGTAISFGCVFPLISSDRPVTRLRLRSRRNRDNHDSNT